MSNPLTETKYPICPRCSASWCKDNRSLWVCTHCSGWYIGGNLDLLFPTCPRCGACWDECIDSPPSGWKLICHPCQLQASPFMIRLIVGKYAIYWYYNKEEGKGKGKMSMIYRAEPVGREFGKDFAMIGEPVEINSWLPFSITESRVHLLLLFS